MSESNLALKTCKIIVHRARNLIVKGRDNTNSSFAIISLGKEKFQTAVVDKTLFPQWNEECSLHVYKTTAAVDVIIYNRGLVLDDLIGQVNIPLSCLEEDSKPVRCWYKLEGKSLKSKKERGDVDISMQVISGLNPQSTLYSWSMAPKIKTTTGKDDKIIAHGLKKEKPTTVSNVKPQEMKQKSTAPASVPTSDPTIVKKGTLYGSANDLNRGPTKTPPTQRRRLAMYAPAHRRLSMPHANIDPNTISSSPKSGSPPKPVNVAIRDSTISTTTEECGDAEDQGSPDPLGHRRWSSTDTNIFRSYQTLPRRKLDRVGENGHAKDVQIDVKHRHSFHSSVHLPAGSAITLPAKNTEPEESLPSQDLQTTDCTKTPPIKPPRDSPSKEIPVQSVVHAPSNQTKPSARAKATSLRESAVSSDSTDSSAQSKLPLKIEPKAKVAVKTTTRTLSPVEPTPVIINIDDSISSGYSNVVPSRHRRIAASITPARFSHMSKQDLATKVLDLEEQLHTQSVCLRETQDYLNTLLLRVIVENPSLLNRDLDMDYE